VPPLERLRTTWATTRGALIGAQRQLERQVHGLLRDRAAARDAARALKRLRSRAERESRKAVAGLETRVQALQTRLGRERQAFGRTVRESVQSTLGALNIPTRDEIARLTRRVEALSRRLDARKR
jgi:hypothetical protein